MFDLNKNQVKFATKLGTVVTIFVLLTACSSKEIVNEASFIDHADYSDTSGNESPYVDQAELPVQEPKKVKQAKRSTVKKFKKKSATKPVAKKDRVEPETWRGDKLAASSFDEASLPAIGSVVNSQTPTPPAPPVEGLMADQSLDEPLFESETSTDYSGLILENWHYLLALLGLGLGSWLGYKLLRSRVGNRRKSKRGLVFN